MSVWKLYLKPKLLGTSTTVMNGVSLNITNLFLFKIFFLFCTYWLNVSVPLKLFNIFVIITVKYKLFDELENKNIYINKDKYLKNSNILKTVLECL